MAKGPLLVFKKGICKFSDSEAIRRNSLEDLTKFIKTVCTDWGVPEIEATFVNRPRANYWGTFYSSRNRYSGIITYWIETNSIAYFDVKDSCTPFCEREQLVDTILHELAHYIDTLLNGSTSHGRAFYDVFNALKAVGYEQNLAGKE